MDENIATIVVKEKLYYISLHCDWIAFNGNITNIIEETDCLYFALNEKLGRVTIDYMSVILLFIIIWLENRKRVSQENDYDITFI